MEERRMASSDDLSFILNDAANKLPRSHPIKMRHSLMEKLVYQSSKSNELNHYVFNVKTDADAPTGNWEAMVSVEVLSFTKA
jgi:hypothetical protein